MRRLRLVLPSLLLALLPALLPGTVGALPLGKVKHKHSRESLESIELQIGLGHWVEALGAANGLVARLFDDGKGKRHRELAYALTFAALAEIALEADRDAVWHWNMAQNLAPELTAEALAKHGVAGARLAEKPLRDQRAAVEWLAAAGRLPPAEELEAVPRLRSQARVPRPSQQPGALAGERLRVSFLIGPEGRTHAPKVLTPKADALVIFAALRSLADWTWEPARRGGEAVWVLWEATVDL